MADIRRKRQIDRNIAIASAIDLRPKKMQTNCNSINTTVTVAATKKRKRPCRRQRFEGPYLDGCSEGSNGTNEDGECFSQESDTSDSQHSDNNSHKPPKIMGGIRAQNWEEKFRLLVRYQETHGTTRVPPSHPMLGRWVQTQRAIGSEKSEEYRRKKLDSIGFEWNCVMDPTMPWLETYHALCAYYDKENKSPQQKQRESISLPCELRRWVRLQRKKYNAGKLPQERIELLESIGFEWDNGAKSSYQWMQLYNRLVDYKAKHGHVKIPRNFKEDPQLGQWVTNQRRRCSDPSRKKLLDDIGFDWLVPSTKHSWMTMYNRLVSYKNEHGHCIVPRKFPQDPQLATWVHNQRKRCKKDQSRIDLLNDIGFVWVLKRGPMRCPTEVWDLDIFNIYNVLDQIDVPDIRIF